MNRNLNHFRLIGGVTTFVGVFFLTVPASAAVYNKQLIDNSGFERVSTIIDDWNCLIEVRLKISPYSRSEETCTGYQLDDTDAADGEVSLALGNTASSWYELRYSISQRAEIPNDAAYARLAFSYQWASTDSGESSAGNVLDATNLMIWDIPQKTDNLMYERYLEPFSRTSASTVPDWRRKKMDLLEWRGHTLNFIFSVWNNDSDTSTLLIDNITLRVASHSRLVGRVEDADGDPVPSARVKIKNKAGTILWEGRTNNAGEFDATELRGGPVKRRIFISDDGDQQRFVQRIKWGKRYDRTFVFDPAN
jgi:hypothetical protein